jgi:hypothetical protein
VVFCVSGYNSLKNSSLFLSLHSLYITPNWLKEDRGKSSSDGTRPGQNQAGSPKTQKAEILKNAPECHEGEA